MWNGPLASISGDDMLEPGSPQERGLLGSFGVTPHDRRVLEHHPHEEHQTEARRASVEFLA